MDEKQLAELEAATKKGEAERLAELSPELREAIEGMMETFMERVDKYRDGESSMISLATNSIADLSVILSGILGLPPSQLLMHQAQRSREYEIDVLANKVMGDQLASLLGRKIT